MNTNRTISGPQLRDMLVSAANAVSAHKQEVNELNVFPVPDGDTGTNMSMTMNAAARELLKMDNLTVSSVSETAATSLLRGARGNSGVILSLLFRGIAKELKDKIEFTSNDLSQALQFGVEAAYKAVMKPAEGTILTVARESALAAKEACEKTKDDVSAVLEAVVSTAKATLAKTPDMLPVLKKAGVVDAGGKGLVIIFDAMLQTLTNGVVTYAQVNEAAPAPFGGAAGEAEEEINFTYCTEFIINKDPEFHKDPLLLRAYLESIGDCVLVADDSTFIKVHVHTDNPGNAIQEALKFGFLTDMKIDNMRAQHEKKAAANKSKRTQPEKPIGFVVVAAGTGISDLFRDLGADTIVEGGQTMNPSTEDILDAVRATPAETVIVLPNNKNIILAAEQAASISDVKMHVLHTKTIPQGIAALLNFTSDDNLTTNLLNMEAATAKVKTGLVTFAARDSEFDGKKIKKNEILALNNGKIAFTESDPIKAAVKLAKNISDKSTSYVTLIFGDLITSEQADAARDQIAEKLSPQAEINVINGGQPIYHFIISVE
jgi:DAK2 domain fusion protein YloV